MFHHIIFYISNPIEITTTSRPLSDLFPCKAMCLSLLWVFTLCAFITSVSGILEEFVVRGPDDLNKLALDQLFAERRANPDKDKDDFASESSPLMQRAKNYAVNRGETPSDESLKVVVSIISM